MIFVIIVLLFLVIGLSEIGPVALVVIPLSFAIVVFAIFAGLFWLGSVGGASLVITVIVLVVGFMVLAANSG